MQPDVEIEPFYVVSFILGSLVFCENCRCEPGYDSKHPKYCDDNYHDQAVAMKRLGWTVIGQIEVLCPECSKAKIAGEF